MTADSLCKLPMLLFQHGLGSVCSTVSATFQHPQKSLGTTMVVMTCSQLEQCVGNAKPKAETQICAWLKNMVKTFLTAAILRGTARKEHPLKEKLDRLSKTKMSWKMFKKFGNEQFSKQSVLWNMLINLLENRLCCRFSVVCHLSKFRENIKYFRKCNSYIHGCAFISATGKNRIYFKINSFLFYIFNFKCSLFVTRKMKSTKFKDCLGYFSLVIFRKVFHVLFYLQLHLCNPSGVNSPKQILEEGIWSSLLWFKDFFKWIFSVGLVVVVGVFVFGVFSD